MMGCRCKCMGCSVGGRCQTPHIILAGRHQAICSVISNYHISELAAWARIEQVLQGVVVIKVCIAGDRKLGVL